MRHAGGAKASDHDGMRGAEFAVRMGVVKDYLLSVWMKSMGFQLPPLRTKTKAI